ncbi:MAG: LysE family transporter [Rhodospirillaceae bacterium]|jgi:threonine/homoserine/homoserine lactone efflux protein|nr:LysE family transporter [Rhodospirillaceae bacterium]MBT5456053.1 LysE family transporter [Rhodospirillaceae bacterium]
METFLFFLKGVAAGFVVAAPVGPVAVMCVRRTLVRGALSGYATGLGAAIADTVYGVVAAYGISFLAALLFDNAFWFRLVGGILLCTLAVKTLFSGPAETQAPSSNGLMSDFLSALVVTGTNPITVVAFGVVFTTIGVATAGEKLDWAEALIAGVFVGSALWWATLTGIASLFRPALNRSGLRWINRISAGVILLCGVLMLIAATAPDSPVASLFSLS